MNSDWFFLGIIILVVAFLLYFGADTAEYRAKMNIFSSSWSPDDIHEAQQGKLFASGLGILGVLVALAGIAMEGGSKEKDDKEDDDWWDHDDDEDDKPDETDRVVIIEPKK